MGAERMESSPNTSVRGLLDEGETGTHRKETCLVIKRHHRFKKDLDQFKPGQTISMAITDKLVVEAVRT